METKNKQTQRSKEKIKAAEIKAVKEYGELNRKEKRIYDSVMRSFPNTSHGSALDAAWQGGLRFNFISK